jgi:anti-sigma regulatory factor (Ser/Thr protein kinase)
MEPFNVEEIQRSELYGLQLTLKSDMSRFGDYRLITSSFLREHVGPETLVDDMVLVIDEVLTNVARHSYQGRPDGDIRLRISVEGSPKSSRLLRVSVRDRGEAGNEFRPTRQLADNLARISAGERTGYGLLLLFRVMDRIAYRTTLKGENWLTMSKVVDTDLPDLLYVPRLIEEIRKYELGDASTHPELETSRVRP